MSSELDRLREALADRYRLDHEIGAGGMATVYLAHDVKHGRAVALKVLRPELSATMGPERFLREVTIAANLQHPHILPLYDSGEAAGFLYYVMPFVEGHTLRDRLLKERELPVGDAVRILRDVTDAVAAAHAKGVVHRDLKPENIMLSGRHALVADFGVAKAVSESTGRSTLTTAGVALGTPSYMAPEQATADPHTDHRADIYALGIIAYEVLAGEPPFVRGTPQAMLAAHVTEAPVAVTERRASIPASLAAIVMRCLEKKPADRPQSAEELLVVLETLATSSGGMTPTDTRPVQAVALAASRVRRWRRPAIAAGAVALLVVVAWFSRGVFATRPNFRVRTPVAVVPFEVRSADASLKSLGIDAADRISGALQQAGFGTVVQYRGEATAFTEAAARKIGRTTGAATLVFGAVTERGADVEFEARIVRVADQKTIWSLGPERGAKSNSAIAMDAIKERILGATGSYLNPWMEGAWNPSLYQPVTNLESVRLVIKAQEFFNASSYLKAIPLIQAAFTRDTTYLPALIPLAASYSNLGDWRGRDSILARLDARRARLMPGDALMLDALLSWRASPEQEYRATMAVYAVDSSTTYMGMWSAVRSRRPVDALQFFARRDSTTLSARAWQPWYTVAASAHHMLGQFDQELALAQAAHKREPGAYGHWYSQVRALAAMKRFDEVDKLITESHSLEYTFAPIGLTYGAVLEAGLHGSNDAAKKYAQQVLAGMAQQSDSMRKSFTGTNASRSALRTLGDYKGVVAIYEADAKRQGAAGLGNRILGMRDRIRMGDTTGALALVDSASTQPLTAFDGSHWNIVGQPRYYAANILSLLGKKDEAVALLRDALNNGWRLGADEQLQWYWAPIKDYPPFMELMKLR